MASLNLEERANFKRLSKLLSDKGTEALRITLDTIHSPADLPAVLNANRKNLLRLKFKDINLRRWDLLFPPSNNPPDSKTFDVILLIVLLQNICGLPPPATGWDSMPPDSDRSPQANITRIKLFKNQVYTHASSTKIDNATFEKLCKDVSQALIDLKIAQKEIDDLKTFNFDQDEQMLVKGVEEWFLREVTRGNMLVGRNRMMWRQIAINRLNIGRRRERMTLDRIRLELDLEKDKKESPDLWDWRKTSEAHRERFEKLHEYGRHSPQKLMEINDVRVCFSKEFLIERGSDGTSVFVGLSKDGGERAVKRLVRDDDICSSLAEQEKKILNERNAIKSNHVVKYRFLDKSNPDWLFLIMDLCEETLEEFVQRSNPEDWSKIAREIIRQMLRGLADIHHDPRGILHRDLKPSNILRDVDGNWLLADFGISRILTPGKSTCRSKEKGTDHWRAVESCSLNSKEVRYKKESDVQVAAMIAFYVLTKGKHPFGEEPDQRRNLCNLQRRNLTEIQSI